MRKLRYLAILLFLMGIPASAQPGWGFGQPQQVRPQAYPQYAPPPPAYGQPYGQPQWGAPQGPTAQQQLARIDAEIAEQREAIAEVATERERIDAEVAGLADRRAAAREQLGTRARALYRVQRAGMLPVAGGFDAMLTHLARVERLERIVRSDLGAVRFLGERETALRGEEAALEERVRIAEAEVQRLAQERAAVQQRAESERMYAGIFSAPAPRLPMPQAQPQPGYGLTVRGQQTQARFSAQRGQLALPVGAGGEVRDARRDDGTGLEFTVRAGTTVRAVADGRVAFSRRYGRYGLMVVLDHGDSFYTVYAGLQDASAQLGNWIARSGRIGGASAQPVYFEVRRGTRSLDTRSWLGL